MKFLNNEEMLTLGSVWLTGKIAIADGDNSKDLSEKVDVIEKVLKYNGADL